MPEQMPFAKMQGVGNDFVVVDGRERERMDWPRLALAMCDRRFGIGADGLLVLAASQTADVRMRMFNPDGSEDVCGNGLRCLARYVWERGLYPAEDLRIETLAGVRLAHPHLDSVGGIEAVTVQMGQPQFAPDAIPMATESLPPICNFPLALSDGRTLSITPLSTGSTHAVTFVETLPDDTTFFAVSPQVEHHPLFPERTSLMWARIVNPERLALRIWERGAGETWGCGTGACAAAVAAILRGASPEGRPISVVSRGGELRVRWRDGETIEMTGPAEFVFKGLYPVHQT